MTRRRILSVCASLAVCAVVLGCSGGASEDSRRSGDDSGRLPTTLIDSKPVATTAPTTVSSSTSTTVAPTTVVTTAPTTSAPAGRTGVFKIAPGNGEVVGRGPLRTYSVEVEEALGLDPVQVAAEVDRTLGDARSWIAEGSVSFQRVDHDASIRVLVATPATVDSRCLPLNTAGTLSCRSGNSVNINSDRWNNATDDWTLDLSAYRSYVINHEIGHTLGRGHQDCPGKGALAPLMMQQTKGLDGCLPNPWPYP